MQYKLIEDSLNDITRPIQTVLYNRGIIDCNKYLHLDEACIQDYNDLDNMQEAVECFVKHYEAHDKILVMPDEDTDGYTSSAMLYLYIKSIAPDYPVEYMMHQHNKAHGLADKDYTIPNNTKLFIIADAGTNDSEACNELIENGIDIIILDHHMGNYVEEGEEATDVQAVDNNNAIIVNNQLSYNYHNKDLSGAGIVYRFLQALDEELWESYADDFIDLCSLGNAADVMDMRSYETRYFVEKGMKNIKNNFYRALIETQNFSMKGIINIHNITWFISPVINAMTRIGTLEERELMFKAITNQYDEFDYTKRDGTVIKEDIYTRAARLAKNAKSRQDNIKKKIVKEIQGQINPDNKVIIAESTSEESGLLGLAAMMISDTYQKPTILVKKRKIDDSIVFNGSIRNFDNSPIEDFRQFIIDTNTVNWVTGHPNAAGISISPDKVEEAQMAFNEALKSIDMTPTYYVDFDINAEDLNIKFIQELDDNKWIWGTGIKEPKLLIKNITVAKKDIILQGADKNSVCFTINDIKYVQFKLHDGDALYDFVNDWDKEDDDEITVNIVAECSINEYQGVYTPQIVINDCEIVEV